MSNYEKVKQFTIESGFSQPNKPQIMTIDDIKFGGTMLGSELAELALTQNITSGELIECLVKGIMETYNKNRSCCSDTQSVLAMQHDAIIDIEYYLNNMCAKKGWNQKDACFDLIHEANMTKRFPDGKFHRREDGKIIKPNDWKEPNLDFILNNVMLI